jgi:hypothetical protein
VIGLPFLWFVSLGSKEMNEVKNNLFLLSLSFGCAVNRQQFVG